ncbi:MAG: nuclear transport factor 2 family protein [Proteobacteria bacterium]|nr:nuclear transport factor 2 family protein [Pseudomonadota bacterium]
MSIDRMKKAGTVASVDDPHLQELLDKQACAEVMMTYCRAIDHRDEALLRSVFHPDSYHRHGLYEGPSTNPKKKSKPGKPADFVGYALEVLRGFTRTHHQLGNIFVEVERGGEVAFTEAYFRAYHRKRAKGDPKAAADAYATEMDWWVGGRYMDKMEKRNGVWKIAFRIGITDWNKMEGPTSAGFDGIKPDLLMQQSRKDMLFHRRQASVKP